MVVAAAEAVAVAGAAAVAVIEMPRKNRILLQFHITGRCNLRCKHCYRTEGDVETLSLEQVKEVIEQFKQLRLEYNRVHGIQAKGHINLTGGEPFFRADIRQILEYMGENEAHFTYGILSNGSFIDDEMIELLKKTKVSFVQLSLDGNRTTHDSLRAPGDYDRVLNTAEYLEKQGIRTYISFTANRENYRHLPAVARQCRKRRITKLWSDRLVPIGNGEELSALAITPDVIADYLKTLKRAQGNILIRALYPKTQVTMNRALQFLCSDGAVYSCSAADSLITVDEFGTVMPCRRMPIPCGDIRTSTLKEIYFGHKTFLRLREKYIPKECGGCRYAYLCRGGAKCQCYAAYGAFWRADPACRLAKRR